MKPCFDQSHERKVSEIIGGMLLGACGSSLGAARVLLRGRASPMSRDPSATPVFTLQHVCDEIGVLLVKCSLVLPVGENLWKETQGKNPGEAASGFWVCAGVMFS